MAEVSKARPEEKSHLPLCNIKIGGAQAPRQVMLDLLECVVENSLHLPDVCTLRLHDAQFHWLDADTFKEGTAIQILGGAEKSPLMPLFFGEVVGMELDLAAHGVPTIVIRCMDRSHRMHRGRQQRSFVQMKDSDIVSKIGRECGFAVKADPTSQVHDWVFQNNQTNWEFLRERALYNGCRLYLNGEKELRFERVKNGASSGFTTIKVTWGEDLRSFRPRIAAGPQVDEVVVRGWDPKTKRSIVGRCNKPAGLPQVNKSDGSKAGSAFGAARMVVVDRPVHTQAEAEDLARSLCDEIGGEYLEAEGLCYGAPKILPGSQVEIDNIGKKFSGKYFVTATTHTYTPAEGYTTLFSATGKRTNTLLSLLEGEEGNGANGTKNAPLGSNIVVALVTDNKDPDNLGRVKVKYPWLSEEHTSFWARQACPMAGADRGFYFLPEIDDEVLVAFEQGDIRRPYLIGALWNGKDKPVEGNSVAVKNGKVERRTIKTRIGHTILLDDTDGKGEMSLTTKAKNRVVLDDKNENITAITTKGHRVFLDDKGKKIIVEDSSKQNRITINTNDNSMMLECAGNFTVDAKQKVLIKGQTGISIETPQKVEVKGQVGVDVQGQGQVNIKSGGVASFEATGPMNVKSSAILNINGTMVNIN